MRKLTLTNHVQSDTTVLENEFIDHYMAEANGEYVKDIKSCETGCCIWWKIQNH